MKKIAYFLLILLLIPAVAMAKSYEKNARLRISDDDVSINDYFNLNSSNIRWSISDPSVLAIVDNMIKPIKTGEAEITATSNGDSYILRVEIVDDNYTSTTTEDKDINEVMNDVSANNPQTDDEIELLVLIVVLSLITIIFFKYKMQYGRFE